MSLVRAAPAVPILPLEVLDSKMPSFAPKASCVSFPSSDQISPNQHRSLIGECAGGKVDFPGGSLAEKKSFSLVNTANRGSFSLFVSPRPTPSKFQDEQNRRNWLPVQHRRAIRRVSRVTRGAVFSVLRAAELAPKRRDGGKADLSVGLNILSFVSIGPRGFIVLITPWEALTRSI